MINIKLFLRVFLWFFFLNINCIKLIEVLKDVIEILMNELFFLVYLLICYEL